MLGGNSSTVFSNVNSVVRVEPLDDSLGVLGRVLAQKLRQGRRSATIVNVGQRLVQIAEEL